MTPWKDTVTIPDGSTVDHALGIALRHSVRRMPVVNHDGHVTGVVHLDDLARELHEHRGTPSIRRVESLQRTPAYASARRSAGDVAEAMHQSGVHTAIVLDRHKRPVGLVTLGQLRRTRPHHEANLFTTTQPGLMPGPRDTTVARRLHVRSHMSTICAERTTALRL
nr:CBS domain-containing protein [Kibdelosporangium phytohabitans]